MTLSHYEMNGPWTGSTLKRHKPVRRGSHISPIGWALIAMAFVIAGSTLAVVA